MDPTYETLNDLVKAFLTGNFKFSDKFTINDVGYHFRTSPIRPFEDYVTEGKKGYYVYTTGKQHAKTAREANLNQWLIFTWSMLTTSYVMSPLGIMPTTEARGSIKINEQDTSELNMIGDIVAVNIVKPSGFSFTSPLKGKVDTGASMCSLHVDNWKENGNEIVFTSKAIADGKEFTVPKDTMIPIKSAEGTEYRPVVIMSLKINETVVPDMQVNLNNRSGMEHPILVGQNALEKGKFIIDPSQTKERYEGVEEIVEEFDFKYIEEKLDGFDFDEQTKEIRAEMLEKNDVTQGLTEEERKTLLDLISKL